MEAWNNVNLVRLTEKIKSPLVLCASSIPCVCSITDRFFSAHVRATTAGSLSLDNCHPWHFGKLMVCNRQGSVTSLVLTFPVVDA